MLPGAQQFPRFGIPVSANGEHEIELNAFSPVEHPEYRTSHEPADPSGRLVRLQYTSIPSDEPQIPEAVPVQCPDPAYVIVVVVEPPG